MHFGIDSISFYTSKYYLDLRALAAARGLAEDKFYLELGQKRMAVAPPDEDIITLAANAVSPILAEEERAKIGMVMFATESGIDQAKAAASYIHRLFALPPQCRVIELKQACYSATFGLQLALHWLYHNPTKKVLVLAADIAKYQFCSLAESSQGCGAVALLLSANPRVLSLETTTGYYTREVMDFWRPNYSEIALVNGKLSCDTYLHFAEESWRQYTQLTGRTFWSHNHFCYHTPVAKLVELVHRKLARLNGVKKLTAEQLSAQIGASLIYGREVGNCYTASLYLSIISLLDNITTDLTGQLIGLYSYGSGSSGEFFAARVVPGYQERVLRTHHQQLLAARAELTVATYEQFYQFKLPHDDSEFQLPRWSSSKFRLSAIKQQQRIYEHVE